MAETPAVVVTGEAFVMVVESGQPPAIVLAAGDQGPPGPPGVGGADISPDAGNQLESRPNGLYAAPPSWAVRNW